jgi:hypothetical protein
MFSFPYERVTLPVNFYLLNILRVLFWNCTFFLFVLILIISITLFLELAIQIVIVGKPLGQFTSMQSIYLLYHDRKAKLLRNTAVAICVFMVIAYEYKDAILDLILELDYLFQWNGEMIFYI